MIAEVITLTTGAWRPLTLSRISEDTGGRDKEREEDAVVSMVEKDDGSERECMERWRMGCRHEDGLERRWL